MRWRSYQIKILESFENLRLKGKNSFHLVAPPGSGKTILGLEMIRRIGKKAVILSPTQVIQHQWMKELPMISPDKLISDDPELAYDILSLTYQSFSVKTPGGEEIHPNSQALMALLADHPVLVLDECHHLTAWWAKAVKKVMADHNPLIIGLTATPPLDRELEAWNHYLEILGDPDMEVPLPSVVKEGYLAPYQDLAYLTQPTREEVLQIREKQQAFESLLNLFEVPPEPLPSLHSWARDQWEAQGIGVLRDLTPLQEALFRYLTWRGEPLGFLSQEVRTRLGGDDWLTLFNSYYIDNFTAAPAPPTWLAGIESTGPLAGLEGSPGNLVCGKNSIGKILEFSPGKAQGAAEILSMESKNLGNDLRALVLTDFDIGYQGQGSSGDEVFKALLANKDTNALDPVLISGKRLVIDGDLAEVFLIRAREFCLLQGWDVELSLVKMENSAQLLGQGPGWSPGRWTLLASSFFERGLTRCLVGTRSLLGEGWNSLKLNTLVDLTLTKSFVSTNQIRGRVLRLDPDVPLKLANIWEVITLGPGFWEAEADLVRMEQKYSHFYGPGADGLLERGLGHLHPMLVTAEIQDLQNQAPRINGAMAQRAAQRWEAYEKWKVGTPCEGQQSHCLDVKIHDDIKGSLLPNAPRKGAYKGKTLPSRIIGSGLFFLGLFCMPITPPDSFLTALFLGFGGWLLGIPLETFLIRPFQDWRHRHKYSGAFSIFKALTEAASWGKKTHRFFEMNPLDNQMIRIRASKEPQALLDLQDILVPSGKTRYLGAFYVFTKELSQWPDMKYPNIPPVTMAGCLKIGLPRSWGRDKNNAYLFVKKWQDRFGTPLIIWYQKGKIPQGLKLIQPPWKVYKKDLWL